MQQIKDLAHAQNASQQCFDGIDAIAGAVNQTAYDQAQQQTNELLKQALPPEVKAALQKFAVDLKRVRDQTTQDREDKMAKILAKIADACWKAKTPEDLTAVTGELQTIEASGQGNQIMLNFMGRGSSPDQFLNAWAEYLRGKQSGDVHAELENLKNIQTNQAFESITALFPKEGLSALRAQIREPVAKQVMDQLDQIPALIAQAKTSQDLATITAKLESIKNLADADFIGVAAANRFNRDQNALNNWITLVSAEETGDLTQALKSFSDFVGDPGDIIAPEMIAAKRSQLFQETMKHPAKNLTLESIAEFAKKLEAVKNPDELDGFIDNLELLHQAGFQNNESDLLPLENDLTSLAKQWRYLNEGRFDGFWNFESDLADHPWKDNTAEMRKGLVIQALHQQFGVFPDPPSVKSIPEAFNAALKETIAQVDWAKAEQILLTMNRFLVTTGGNTDLQDETLKAVRAYLEGANSEQAGQWTDAIVSYRKVVSHSGPYVPRQPALEHLAKILKEHPEAAPKP